MRQMKALMTHSVVYHFMTVPPRGSVSNNFSDDKIDAIPQSTLNVHETKLVRRGICTRGSSRSGSASSSGKTQSITRPGKDWICYGRTNKRRFPFTSNSGIKNVPSDPRDILAVFKTFSQIVQLINLKNLQINIQIFCKMIQ